MMVLMVMTFVLTTEGTVSKKTLGSYETDRLTKVMGFDLALISLAIWHQVQGPQKKANTQSSQTLPCEDEDTVREG